MSSIKIVTWALLIAGLAVLTGIVAWQGFEGVAALIGRGGWWMLALALFCVPQIVMSAWAWHYLFPHGRAPRFSRNLAATAVGTYANTLLPLAEIGGEVIRARIAMQGGTSGRDAGASVVVDKTVQTLALIAWACIGIGALVLLTGSGPIVIGAIVGVLLLTAGVVGFIVVQHKGLFGPMAGAAAKVTKSATWVRLAGGARALDQSIRALYRRKGRLAWSTFLRLVGRVLMVGEIWLAAHLIGHPIGLLEAVALRSLGVTIRSAAFVLPAGYGLQEGSYVAIGALLGIAPDVSLVLSLATRIREIVAGVPSLVAWQWVEGRGLKRRRRERSAATSGTTPATGGDG